ncbi:diaminopimelate epimerase [Leeia aquatica]|uniref:Diaminopimelate epimerase n=1 Tax=Leeia aquatica TaxID=2725557 RepID=A0A847SGN3_9NEIS|nr:diaminopimelate epimerase [Leeia aquatica]NLR76536.1 diaminopimelate epimerase [Leeia aquatica]
MKTLPFTKMHGLGNNFMVLDGVRQPIQLNPEQLRLWGDWRLGVGFDQLLLVEPADHPDNDFKYRIFNCDGSEVEQCGNGARCFARYVYDHGLTEKRALRVETARGLIRPQLEADGMVTVDMGVPVFAPANLPFVADAESLTYPLALADGQTVQVSIVSMGNPHAVQRVDDVDTAPVSVQGPQIEQHPRFPQKVNAGFLQVVDRQHIRLRVYERAAGETLACGTGACAAVVAGIRQGWLDAAVTVQTRGGELRIRWEGPGQPVWMTGPTVTVFEGQLSLD